MDKEHLQRRVGAIRSQLSKNHVDALVLTKPANVTYLTGFSGEDSWAVVTGRAVYLLTDSRYTEQAQKECPLARIVQRKDPIAEAGGKLLGKLKFAKTVAVEKSISLEQYDVLKKNMDVRLKAADGLVEDAAQRKGCG